VKSQGISPREAIIPKPALMAAAGGGRAADQTGDKATVQTAVEINSSVKYKDFTKDILYVCAALIKSK